MRLVRVTVVFILFFTSAVFCEVSDFWEGIRPGVGSDTEESHFILWSNSGTEDDTDTESGNLFLESETDSFIFINNTFRYSFENDENPIIFLPAINHAYLQVISLQEMSRLASQNRKDDAMIQTIIGDVENNIMLEISPLTEGEIAE